MIHHMEDERRINWGVLILSGSFVFLVGLDLITDFKNGSSGYHLLLEATLLILSSGLFIVAIKKLLTAKKEIRRLHGDLDRINAEQQKWKKEANTWLDGLSIKIEEQFQTWKLTPAETEIGFLLLKGFSLKEIAEIRNTKIKTVQQQSQSIYQKTDLQGRSELAAFFLEDLLPGRKQH